MYDNFQYSIKSTSEYAPVNGYQVNPTLPVTPQDFDWSSKDSPIITAVATTYRNILEIDSESEETNPRYDYNNIDAAPVTKGMELTEDEVGFLCDFIDGTDDITPQPQVIDNVLEKVFNGGAALDNNEPRYQKDFAQRKQNTKLLDAGEKITIAEIWELIRCQEGYREHSNRALNNGVVKVSNGDCGRIEFILEAKREAANKHEKEQFYAKMRSMEEQLVRLQRELEDTKRADISRQQLSQPSQPLQPLHTNISINEEPTSPRKPKKGFFESAIDTMIPENNCVIS